MKWTTFPCNQFDKVSAHWDTLNQSALQQPILDSMFIKVCLDVFAKGDEVIALCEDETGPISVGVFHKVGFGRYATFQPSQAPLGLFLVRNNQLSNRLLKGLAAVLPGHVILIDLLQQDSGFLSYDEETNVLQSPYIITGRLDVAQDFELFFASLGKNMRQNYNKVINRCTRQHIELEAQCLSSSENISEAIALFGQFESNGWKGQSGTAVNINNDQGKFYQQLLQQYAKHDQAEIWRYQVDQQTVAIDLCIKSADILIILKTAYNEEFKKLSPALQLKFEILKHHAADTSAKRLKSVEFFGKAMEWHKRFNAVLRPITHLTFFSQPLWRSLYRLIKFRK